MRLKALTGGVFGSKAEWARWAVDGKGRDGWGVGLASLLAISIITSGEWPMALGLILQMIGGFFWTWILGKIPGLTLKNAAAAWTLASVVIASGARLPSAPFRPGRNNRLIFRRGCRG